MMTNEWIEWNGGDCPVAKDVRVDFEFMDGSLHKNRLANSINWYTNIGRKTDIKQYRLSKEQA